MTWAGYHVGVPGKWVLAGEHSVLKGGTAIALPHPEFGLALTFQPQVWEGLTVLPPEAQAEVEQILNEVCGTQPLPRGTVHIESTIPVGAGLGSSAAFCVALTRWLSEPLAIPESEQLAFATRLENRFHGKSSGMDVAAIMAGAPVRFTMAGGPESLGITKLPQFTFHDTGLRARTSACVKKVERFRETNGFRAVEIDEQMSQAAGQAIEGLQAYNEGDDEYGLQFLARAMELARRCFYAWDLVPQEVRDLESRLLSEGARAVKLTGAGDGGFVVALWE